jgi:uncharacterized protein
VVSENFLGREGSGAGKPLQTLEKVRASYPIVLHGVSLSIGSADPLKKSYLKRLKALADAIEPEWLSDHLCWTGVDGKNLHDLLPLPFTSETLDYLIPRITRVQDFLGRRILLENVSSYFEYSHSEMTEWEFLAELSHRADCGILLDVNNVYVSSVNHGFDAMDFLKAMPAERVGQIHLAGHSDHGNHLIDTHDEPVCDAVWELYENCVRLLGPISPMVERDANIPEFSELLAELRQARKIQEKAIAEVFTALRTETCKDSASRAATLG